MKCGRFGRLENLKDNHPKISTVCESKFYTLQMECTAKRSLVLTLLTLFRIPTDVGVVVLSFSYECPLSQGCSHFP